jgi:hypothetical protein
MREQFRRIVELIFLLSPEASVYSFFATRTFKNVKITKASIKFLVQFQLHSASDWFFSDTSYALRLISIN